MAAPSGYSRLQIRLHWAVVVLIALQFLLHEGMETAYEALDRGFQIKPLKFAVAWSHILGGGAIFALALWRLALRRRGVPPLPEAEPAPLRRLATGTHITLYALMLGMPISGALAWFGRIDIAAVAHGAAAGLLIAALLLHIAGALTQHVVFKTDVLRRMLRAAR